jgi:hypothetical protein
MYPSMIFRIFPFIWIVLFMNAVASAPTMRDAVARSVSSETLHINASIHGNRNLDTVNNNEAIARQSLESPRIRRSMSRSESPESYPSPHGKGARWRFDLRHTVETDLSKGVRDSLETIQASTKAAVLRGSILRAHVLL